MSMITLDSEAVISISIYTITLVPDSEGKTNKLKMERISKVSDTTSSGRRKLIGIALLTLLTKDIKIINVSICTKGYILSYY